MRVALLLVCLVAPLAHAQSSPPIPTEWVPEADTIAVEIPEASWSLEMAVAELDSVNVFNLPLIYGGAKLSVSVFGGRDTLRIAPEASGVYRVHLRGLAQEAAMDFAFWPPEDVHFSDAFRAEHGGTSRFLTPEVFEFLNVVFALTPSGRETESWLILKQGDYYESVMEHFGSYADHPFVAAMEAVIQDDEYVMVRSNGLAFRFEGDRLVADPIYRSLGRGHERIESLLPLAESFSEASGFRDFYAAHEAEYARQRQEMERLLPVNQMWGWLEAEFPERSQGYLTVFSPLINGTHNAIELRDGDYRESVIFLPGPPILDAFGDGDSVVGTGTPAWREVEMTRMAFTEYDHTYVNPAMGPLAAEISEAMIDVSAWNRATDYQSPSETFAEYMTWGVFLLYVDAFYPADTAQEAREGTIELMEDRRGFFRFGDFMDALTLLYDARTEGETLNDLLPAIVQWTARQ
ncbi:MAG: hypothetical protein Rubg2KO_34530 [Rubricoccaceae bacterium]